MHRTNQLQAESKHCTLCFEAKRYLKLYKKTKVQDCVFNGVNEGKSNNPIKHGKQHNHIKKYGEI